MRKALLLLISHIVRLGPVQGIRVLWIKKLPKGKLRQIDAPWLGGRLWLRPGTADINTIDQILIGPYMPVEADWDPGTVIDCGANIGLATRYLQHAYPEAHIIAVEPEEGNFACVHPALPRRLLQVRSRDRHRQRRASGRISSVRRAA